MKKQFKAKFEDLIKLNGWQMFTSKYRAMLDYLEPKCYVEAQSSDQHGIVDKVIRNSKGIPVCVRVKSKDVDSGKSITDYISVDRIDFFEPYRFYTMDEFEYSEDYSE